MVSRHGVSRRGGNASIALLLISVLSTVAIFRNEVLISSILSLQKEHFSATSVTKSASASTSTHDYSPSTSTSMSASVGTPPTRNACDSARQLIPDSIIANVSIAIEEEPARTRTSASIKFPILVFSPSRDKYISRGILRGLQHERDMSKFIARALSPLQRIPVEEEEAATTIWAVDIGTNLGYHSLHMAKRGARVISFEPAPDTRALLKCSVEISGFDRSESTFNADQSEPDALSSSRGSIKVIPAGASDVETRGHMSRHEASPGMTSFVAASNSSFDLENLNFSADQAGGENSTMMDEGTDLEDEGAGGDSGGSIRLVRVQDILKGEGLPEGRSSQLRLLKLDAEGYELKALRGLNFTRYPFQFFTFEYFPTMLKNAGTNPLDLLMMVRKAGYVCDVDKDMGDTMEEMQIWTDKLGKNGHANLFCVLKDE